MLARIDTFILSSSSKAKHLLKIELQTHKIHEYNLKDTDHIQSLQEILIILVCNSNCV